jgi:hypothetical protein
VLCLGVAGLSPWRAAAMLLSLSLRRTRSAAEFCSIAFPEKAPKQRVAGHAPEGRVGSRRFRQSRRSRSARARPETTATNAFGTGYRCRQSSVARIANPESGDEGPRLRQRAWLALSLHGNGFGKIAYNAAQEEPVAFRLIAPGLLVTLWNGSDEQAPAIGAWHAIGGSQLHR